MKTLFQNYSSKLTTEPLYLHASLKNCGIDAEIWSDPNVSAFDILDLYQPDAFVAHWTGFSNDLVTYLSGNKKIETALNVTGADDNLLPRIVETLESSNINVKFLFTNDVFNTKTSVGNYKLHNIFPAADIFSIRRGTVPQIQFGFVYDDFSENLKKLVGEKEVYHLLYVGDKEENESDVSVDAMNLSNLYGLYDTIFLVGEEKLYGSQIFFDATLNSKKVQVACTDQEKFSKLLTKVFNCDLEDEGDDVAYQVKQQIKTRHTPFHRAWTLMKYFKNEDAQSKLVQAKDNVANMLGEI